MRTGKVKFFNHKSKFGFVIDDETKEEYYVHKKATDSKLNEDDLIQFELKPSKKGYECAVVRKII